MGERRDTSEEEVLDGDDIPADVTIEADFAMSEAPTPTDFGQRGSCWKCLRLIPVQIVAPPPGSSHEALRFTTCIVSAGRDWAVCAVQMVVRLGPFELYVGPNRRLAKLPPPGGTERRLVAPRKDDE